MVCAQLRDIHMFAHLGPPQQLSETYQHHMHATNAVPLFQHISLGGHSFRAHGRRSLAAEKIDDTVCLCCLIHFHTRVRIQRQSPQVQSLHIREAARLASGTPAADRRRDQRRNQDAQACRPQTSRSRAALLPSDEAISFSVDLVGGNHHPHVVGHRRHMR